jgi:hypothetical protein
MTGLGLGKRAAAMNLAVGRARGRSGHQARSRRHGPAQCLQPHGAGFGGLSARASTWSMSAEQPGGRHGPRCHPARDARRGPARSRAPPTCASGPSPARRRVARHCLRRRRITHQPWRAGLSWRRGAPRRRRKSELRKSPVPGAAAPRCRKDLRSPRHPRRLLAELGELSSLPCAGNLAVCLGDGRPQGTWAQCASGS